MAITQTMIGEFMYKYTKIGKGHEGRRHWGFFWMHPYTKTLYWSSSDPSSSSVNGSKAKWYVILFSYVSRWVMFILVCFIAFIEGVKSLLDPDPVPSGFVNST